MDIDWTELIETLLAAIVCSLVGVTLFAASFAMIAALAPFSLRRQIEEKQNVALAILLGSIVVGLSIIIAAAVS